VPLKYSKLLHIVTPHRNTLLIILALFLANSAAALANPWIAGLLTRSILQEDQRGLPAFQWIQSWSRMVSLVQENLGLIPAIKAFTRCVHQGSRETPDAVFEGEGADES
jgi:hypothetical protein